MLNVYDVRHEVAEQLVEKEEHRPDRPPNRSRQALPSTRFLGSPSFCRANPFSSCSLSGTERCPALQDADVCLS